MPKYHETGAFIDQLTCEHCKRMYRGATRTINKLMILHMLKEHNITLQKHDSKPDVVTRSINLKNQY